MPDPVSAFLPESGVVAFAHRGFAQGGDENSMAAFERAVALGYRYLETDARVTADGVAVAFHDSTLDRVTDSRGRVDRLPWASVRSARIDGREPIPLLVDLLDRWPDVRINIDVKSWAAVTPVVEAVRRTGTVARVCVAAFSARRIAAVRRELGTALCTALGPRDALTLSWRPDRLRTRALAGRCAQVPPRMGPRALVDARYVGAAHRRGVAVHVWTVDDRDEMTRLLDLGVDGIMTDRADLLRDVLTARGEWPALP